MSRQAWLLYNFGTQEPRINTGKEFVLLKGRHDCTLQRLLAQSAKGLWPAAQALFEHYDHYRPNLRFPILDPAIRYATQRSGSPLKKLKLIATNASNHAGLRDEDPRWDDTYWAAKLAQKWAQEQYKDQIESVEIVELSGDSPHLYRNAKRLLANARILDGLTEDVTIFVCTSPGLPAVNNAVLQTVLQKHSGRCFPFQIEQPDLATLLRGEQPDTPQVAQVAETEIFVDLVARQLKVMIDDFQYENACRLLAEMPLGPGPDESNDARFKTKEELSKCLRIAADQWALRFERGTSEPWQMLHLRRTYASFRIGAALLANHFDDAIVWLGDSYEFAKDFLYAHIKDEETLLTNSDTARRRPSAWQNELSHLPNWTMLCRFQGLKTVRNNFIHRLQPGDPDKLLLDLRTANALNQQETLRDVPGKLEALLDQIVTSQNLGSPAEIKASVLDFPAYNQRLKQLVDTDLVGTEI